MSVLGIGLLALAPSGLGAVAVGVVLTGPYTSWVAADLFGKFSALTDVPVEQAAATG